MHSVDVCPDVLNHDPVLNAYFDADGSSASATRSWGEQVEEVTQERLMEESGGQVTRMLMVGRPDRDGLRRQETDLTYKVLMGLKHAELKALCIGHRSPVSGIKGVLTNRIIDAGLGPSERQSRSLLQLERRLTELGVTRPIVLGPHIATREASARFLSQFESLCISHVDSMSC